MTSSIDPTKPTAGNALTLDVRDNFASAKSEIEALQTYTTDETTRVDTALAARGMRAGDLGGTAASTTVTGLQTRPVNAAAPTTDQLLGWNGTNWAPRDVLQLGGRALNPVIPSSGQVMAWSGTEWRPTTGAAGPAPYVVYHPLPNGSDIHNWIAPGTEGVFFGVQSAAANIINAPALGIRIHYTGWSTTDGVIRLEAYLFSENVYNTVSLAQKHRLSNGSWSGWYSESTIMAPSNVGWRILYTGTGTLTIPQTPSAVQLPGLISNDYMYDGIWRVWVAFDGPLTNVVLRDFTSSPPGPKTWAAPSHLRALAIMSNGGGSGGVPRWAAASGGGTRYGGTLHPWASMVPAPQDVGWYLSRTAGGNLGVSFRVWNEVRL